jgi:multiple sugar transport system permease protein
VSAQLVLVNREQKIWRAVSRIFVYAFVVIISVTSVFPFVWMISASLKTEATVFAWPIEWIPRDAHWSNYQEIFERVNMLVYFRNTVIISIAVTAIQLSLASLAAYAFAKIVFPGRDILFLLFLATLMIPYQVIMIPVFVIVRTLGLIDTKLGLILSCSFNAFSIFFMKQYFMTIPNEYVEAARIDGMSELRIFGQVIAPLSRPAIATLAIYTFVGAWNDFLGPLVLLSSDHNLTIQLGIRKFITQYSARYELIMATAVLAIVPILLIFLYFQKHFVKGMALSGLKA